MSFGGKGDRFATSLWRQWFFGLDEIKGRLKNYERSCNVQYCMQSDGRLESRTILCCLLEAQRALLCSLHEMSRLYALSCILWCSLPSLYFFIPLWFFSPSVRFRITTVYINAARRTSLKQKYHHCYVRRSCNVIPRRPRPLWVETHRHADAGF
jgi:hypothetical protein